MQCSGDKIEGYLRCDQIIICLPTQKLFRLNFETSRSWLPFDIWWYFRCNYNEMQLSYNRIYASHRDATCARPLNASILLSSENAKLETISWIYYSVEWVKRLLELPYSSVFKAVFWISLPNPDVCVLISKHSKPKCWCVTSIQSVDYQNSGDKTYI